MSSSHHHKRPSMDSFPGPYPPFDFPLIPTIPNPAAQRSWYDQAQAYSRQQLHQQQQQSHSSSSHHERHESSAPSANTSSSTSGGGTSGGGGTRTNGTQGQLKCTICNTSYRKNYDLQRHFKTTMHRTNEERAGSGIIPTPGGGLGHFLGAFAPPGGGGSGGGNQPRNPSSSKRSRRGNPKPCKICDHIYSSSRELRRHMVTKKHQEKEAELRARGINPALYGEGNDDVQARAKPKRSRPRNRNRIPCETCGTTYEGQYDLQRHYLTQKHLNAVKGILPTAPSSSSASASAASSGGGGGGSGGHRSDSNGRSVSSHSSTAQLEHVRDILRNGGLAGEALAHHLAFDGTANLFRGQHGHH